MPPKGRVAKGSKGKVKSKSILSFFAPPPPASSTPASRAAPSASIAPASRTATPLGPSSSPGRSSEPCDLVDLTDDSRSSPGQRDDRRGAIEASFERGGGLDPRGPSSTSSSSSSLAGGPGAECGSKSFVGFVRASSLSRNGGSGSGDLAVGQPEASRITPSTGTAAGSAVPAAGATAAAAATAVRSTAPASKSPSASSWGSLGRGGNGVVSAGGGHSATFSRSMNSDKPIKLSLHVVGLQFREQSPAWSAPASPGQQDERQHHPAGPATSPHSICSNTALELEREPYNSHDRNAIKVLLPPPAWPSRFLGYVPGRIAVLLAPLLDASPPAARVILTSLQDEDEEGGVERSGPRNTLPALLEVKPLGGAGREPFSGLVAKLREAAKKEDKRQQKRRSESKANKERLRSKQKTLLLDFGRSSSASANDGGAASASSGSSKGGAMLESMPWEVLWQVFCSPGVSSRELFGPIRGVCCNWMRAVDAMPCAAARREVAKVCAGEPAGEGGTKPLDQKEGGTAASSSGSSEAAEKAASGASGSSGEKESHEGLNSPSLRNAVDSGGCGNPDRVRQEEGPARRRAPGVGGSVDGSAGGGDSGQGGEGGGETRGWWGTVRARLVQGGGFTECAAADLLARLEWAAEQETDDDDDDGGGALEDGGAAASSVEAGNGDGNPDDGSGSRGDGSGRGRRRRMLRHLEATRALCEEWRLQAGTGHAESSGGGGGGGSGAGGSSWSGWEAFGLAVATSASRDRLSLCCWAVRPLMGGDTTDGGTGGDGDGDSGVGKGWQRKGPPCPGLPRGEVIELLCLVLCALRSVAGEGRVGGGGGVVRLKADLLMCARVLENWDVRFQKPGQPGGVGGGVSGGGSTTPTTISGGGGGASGLISNLTAEQRSIVLADVKPGGVLTVLAFAGTGKTTCLRAYSQARPHLKILYLTFNVSVREEAEKTFPPHVACKGVHQLAFRFVGRRFQSKLTQDLRESDVQAFLKGRLGNKEKISLATTARVLSTLNAFFSSDSPALSSSHVQAPPPELVFLEQQQQQQRREQQQQQDPAGSGNDGGGVESEEDGDSSDSDGEDTGAGTHTPGASSSQPGAPSLQSPSAPGASPAPQAGPPVDPKKKRPRRSKPPVENATILEWAAMAWAEMQSTAPTGAQYGGGGGGAGSWGNGNGQAVAGAVSLGMTHAGYLKLFQLSRPILGRTYDVIMLDEAQDSNPCIASIVLRETGCARILVGDSHQAIYGFIGAEDHLKRVEGGKVRHLTQVFRFDQSIAHVANSLVGPLKGETRPLLGCAGKQGEVVLADGTGLDVWQDQGCRVKRPMAFLARTVSSLVHAAMWARSRGDKVAWVGGAQAYNLEAIEDVCLMVMGRPEEVRHPLLKKLKTAKKLVRFIQESGDRQWAGRLRMIEGKDPRALLTELRLLQRKQVHPGEADTILSTVHKAKGLEFDTVVLADDFIEVDGVRWTSEPTPRPIWGSVADQEEVNILYVAVTRARRRLVVNTSLRAFLANTGAWNSVCLRGVAGCRLGEVAAAADTASSPLAESASARCALCGGRADVGGGGDRLAGLSRAQATAASEEALRAAGGRGFPDPPGDGGAARARAGSGLLYAESGSLKPLCCWCVEGGGSGSASAGAVAAGGGGGGDDVGREEEEGHAVDGLIARALTRAPSSRFPYARVLMRGLANPDERH